MMSLDIRFDTGLQARISRSRHGEKMSRPDRILMALRSGISCCGIYLSLEGGPGMTREMIQEQLLNILKAIRLML